MRTDVVLAAKPLEIGTARVLWMLVTHRDALMNPHGGKLEDVLPRPLYARFAAMRATYAGSWTKWERYQPVIAAALLEDAALEKVGLSQRLDVSLAVRHLARNHHVPIDEVITPAVPDLLDALKLVAPEIQDRCMAAVLDVVEGGLQSLGARASAWGSGDTEALDALPPSPETVCRAALDEGSTAAAELAQARRSWQAALETRLRGGGVTLAVLEVDLLVGADGLLAQLRSDGFAVDTP